MKRLTVLCDLDDVLWDLKKPWIAHVNEKFGTCVQVNDITDWEIQQFFPSLTLEEVYSPLFAPGFWETLQPTQNAGEFISKLKEDGHTVKVVTASFFENVPAKMLRLFSLFPMFSQEDIIITTDKQIIKGDVLLDDGVHNLIGGDYVKLLYDLPHNQRCDCDALGIHRVSTLKQAYQLIRQLAKE